MIQFFLVGAMLLSFGHSALGGSRLQFQDVTSISKFRWQHRILLSTWERKAPIHEKQIAALSGEVKALQERKLRLLRLYGPISKPFQSNRLYLIGLDGSVKNQTTNIFEVQALFRQIDSMPMRVQELNAPKSN